MKRLALLAPLLWLSCTQPPQEGAILVLVDFAPDVTARCIEVVVRSGTGAELRSVPIRTDRKDPAKVGVVKGALPDEVILYAVGYSDDGCMTPTVPPERSENREGTFKVAHLATVSLKLIRHPDSVDFDADGYSSIASGGDDCDDTDRATHPGALESCGDGKDNDCDHAIDCEDPSCADQACAANSGGQCRSGSCAEISCGDEIDNDGDGARDCADFDCAGTPCPNNGVCRDLTCKGASSEKDLCTDGKDNDGDLKIDCDDPDCMGSLCNPGNACLTGTHCDATKACSGGASVSCLSQDPCLKPNGSCNPGDGGCTFAPETGKACDDSNPCTQNDACSAGGICTGTPMGCTSANSCFRSTGCSPDGGCQFAAAVGDLCNDGNSCTSDDHCASDAGCEGAPLVCVPGQCQQPSNQCTADGGCVFLAIAAGTACDGGVCNVGGACLAPFPYPPSNFTESQLPTPGGPSSIACSLTLDSHQSDGGVGFGGWCGNSPPPFRLLPQAGGRDAVLVSFSSVDFAPDASVRLIGDRPVIFAATGNLSVQGELLAGAGSSDCADGGAGGPNGGNRGGGGGAFGSIGGPGGNSGGVGGIVNGEPLLVPLRGGCPGGNGARGGGGLQLSAGGTLSITGAVAAPGSGGRGASTADNGGQGAGSGGGLLLEGLFVLTGPTSAVTANGGSGGEGSGAFLAGDDGVSGSTRTATPAPGADSISSGARGGDGATGTNIATGGGDVVISGGGGGGAGVGRVRINSSTGCSLSGTGVLSPHPTSNKADAGCP